MQSNIDNNPCEHTITLQLELHACTCTYEIYTNYNIHNNNNYYKNMQTVNKDGDL